MSRINPVSRACVASRGLGCCCFYRASGEDGRVGERCARLRSARRTHNDRERGTCGQRRVQSRVLCKSSRPGLDGSWWRGGGREKRARESGDVERCGSTAFQCTGAQGAPPGCTEGDMRANSMPSLCTDCPRHSGFMAPPMTGFARLRAMGGAALPSASRCRNARTWKRVQKSCSGRVWYTHPSAAHLSEREREASHSGRSYFLHTQTLTPKS